MLKRILSKIKWEILRILGIYKPTPNRFKVSTLNERVLNFIKSKENLPLPAREKDFLPEILIPCYNHGKYLEYLFLTLPTDIPITIINDNSTDDTESHINILKQKYRFKVIKNEENLFQYGSVNKAVKESENNLFIIVNADDLMVPTWIHYAIEKMKHSDLFMFAGTAFPFTTLSEEYNKWNHIFAELVQSISYKPNKEVKYYGPDSAKDFTHDNSINMTFNGCIFLKSAWEYIGGMLPLHERVSMHDDRDFQMRICSFFKIGISEDITTLYRTDSSAGKGTL
ncbi:glycosyltransferase family A protein [Chryseobacterium sp. KACC 21268]|nr:glycosyltransferase family A protein [Chryseobacterium sp. KACC 21268]